IKADIVLVPLPHVPKLIPLAKSTIFAKMAEGEFEVIKFGARSFLSLRSINAYIQRNIVPPKIKGAEIEAKAKAKKARAPKRRLVAGKNRRRRMDTADRAAP
ncbi:MAG: hypothetical protein ACREUF_03530, partial [Solimonas sp.]